MPMQCTSIEAYNNALAGMPASRKLVFETFVTNERPLTNLEISNILKKPINKITGRTSELKKAGLITFAGHKTHEGNKHSQWKPIHPDRLF